MTSHSNSVHLFMWCTLLILMTQFQPSGSQYRVPLNHKCQQPLWKGEEHGSRAPVVMGGEKKPQKGNEPDKRSTICIQMAMENHWIIFYIYKKIKGQARIKNSLGQPWYLGPGEQWTDNDLENVVLFYGESVRTTCLTQNMLYWSTFLRSFNVK